MADAPTRVHDLTGVHPGDPIEVGHERHFHVGSGR